MLFHPEKCKVMEISKSKRSTVESQMLSMNHNDGPTRHTLEYITSSEKDLGIYLTPNLKFDTQVDHAVAKATQILGQLKRTFNYWTTKTFKTLFTAFIRPHLEYAVPVWSPFRKRDIKALEKVQRRATKLVPSLRNLKYSERLQELKMTTLEDRRNRGDLIQFFKFYYGFNSIEWQNNYLGSISSTPSGAAAGIRRNVHHVIRPPITNCSQRENLFLDQPC